MRWLVGSNRVILTMYNTLIFSKAILQKWTLQKRSSTVLENCFVVRFMWLVPYTMLFVIACTDKVQIENFSKVVATYQQNLFSICSSRAVLFWSNEVTKSKLFRGSKIKPTIGCATYSFSMVSLSRLLRLVLWTLLNSTNGWILVSGLWYCIDVAIIALKNKVITRKNYAVERYCCCDDQPSSV